MDGDFRLQPEPDGTFRLVGELDMASAPTLEPGIRSRLDGQGDVVLDLSELTFVDSTGIRAFLRLGEQVAPRAVVLRDPRPHVASLLEIVRITDFGIRIDGEASQ